MANEIRVLIAEDDVNMHEEWRESLAAWGFRGEIAEDGVRALELIRSFDPAYPALGPEDAAQGRARAAA